MTLFINIIIVDTMIPDINKTPHTGTTIYINMYIYIYKYIYNNIYICTYICMSICTYTYVCIYSITCMYVYMYVDNLLKQFQSLQNGQEK